MKEHPLYCWTKRELIRPAKQAVRKAGRRGATDRPAAEVARQLRDVRERVKELEREMESAPRRTQERERLRQARRQRLLEQERVLNVSLVASDPRAAAENHLAARRPTQPRRVRNRARKEARLIFCLLLPVCVALCYFTVKLLLS